MFSIGNMHSHTLRAGIPVLRIVLLILLMAGCSANYGSLQRSIDVDRAFNRYEVRYDHRYYYAGGQNDPTAIMAIHEDYTLGTKVWSPIRSISPEVLKRRVEAMSEQLGHSLQNYGGRIVDPAGKAVGLWFSRYTSVIIRFEEDNVVTVTLPRQKESEDRNPRHRFVY
jgi:hypothetical protein